MEKGGKKEMNYAFLWVAEDRFRISKKGVCLESTNIFGAHTYLGISMSVYQH